MISWLLAVGIQPLISSIFFTLITLNTTFVYIHRLPLSATMPLHIAHYIAMQGSSSIGGHFGMPVPPMPPANAYLSSTPRPRPYYCWLHGYNNTHDGCNCNVMGANREYTSQMKAATSPNGTSGNLKLGIPVCLQRSPSLFFTLRLVFCLPLHHPPSFPIPARTQALLVPLSCQLPLSSHLLL
jgi:hypothetical protein